MKIAVITPVFPPYFAGIGRVAEQEAGGLARLGHEVTVLTPEYHTPQLRSNSVEQKIDGIVSVPGPETGASRNDIKVKRLNPPLKFGNAAWLPHLNRELDDFDVIHLHYPFIGGTGAVLNQKSKVKNLKLIVTYHMDLVGRGWKGLFFKLYTRLTLPKLVKAADKIIISSFDYARHGDLASYLKKEPGKFAPVPFGMDKEQRTINKEQIGEIRRKFNINENNKIILFVGGLDKAHYFKGVEVLLKAFKRFCSLFPAPCSLLIVGAGDLRPRYEKQARKLGLGGKVVFAGRVPAEELADYYRAADVFVLPSTTRSEAYGMVLLEAMAVGAPVAASDLPGVRTNVRPEWGRLVKPGDSDGLAASLVELLENEEKRKRMGEKAREWVEKERALKQEMRTLDNIFKDS